MPGTDQNPLQGCFSAIRKLFGGAQPTPRQTPSVTPPVKPVPVAKQADDIPPKKIEMPDIDIQGMIQQNWDLAQAALPSRIVVLHGQITDDTANRLIGHLLLLDRLSRDPILLLIHSEGGQAYAGLAVYDTLRHLSAPLITVAGTPCAGCALLLLLAGHRRYALANSTLTYLTLTSGARGQPSDLVIHTQQMRVLQAQHDRVFQPFAFWDLGALHEFTHQEALDHKMIDGIVGAGSGY